MSTSLRVGVRGQHHDLANAGISSSGAIEAKKRGAPDRDSQTIFTG
jgi:hypothetical protein